MMLELFLNTSQLLQDLSSLTIKETRDTKLKAGNAMSVLSGIVLAFLRSQPVVEYRNFMQYF